MLVYVYIDPKRHIMDVWSLLCNTIQIKTREFYVQGENIIMVELDMPNRTTRDYDGPQVAPRIQAALDAALQDEADIELDGRYVP